MQIVDIKQKIKALKDLAIEKQKLVYKGKVLQNEDILSEIGVKDEDNFVLMSVIARKEEPRAERPNVEIQQKETL